MKLMTLSLVDISYNAIITWWSKQRNWAWDYVQNHLHCGWSLGYCLIHVSI